MFCKLEHMCYLNVQASITIENAYWLFLTTKRTGRIYFSFNLKVAQSRYEMISGYWSRFFRDTLPTMLFSLGRIRLWILQTLKSTIMRWGHVLTFETLLGRKGGPGFWKSKTLWAYIHNPINTPDKTNTHHTLVLTSVALNC
jgi:hypothetical protein